MLLALFLFLQANRADCIPVQWCVPAGNGSLGHATRQSYGQPRGGQFPMTASVAALSA
jgi:hypothetical protein